MNARMPVPNETLPPIASALPEAWITKIFAKFEARYGSLFLDRWRDCNMANVKATWAEELAGFESQPDRIAYALRSLADSQFPPTLPEFVAACRRAPATERQQALPYRPTEADKSRLRAVVSEDAKAVTLADYDPLDWARKPKNQKALDMVIDGSKISAKLLHILGDLIETGICNEAGKLLKSYKGNGQWVKA